MYTNAKMYATLIAIRKQQQQQPDSGKTHIKVLMLDHKHTQTFRYIDYIGWNSFYKCIAVCYLMVLYFRSNNDDDDKPIKNDYFRAKCNSAICHLAMGNGIVVVVAVPFDSGWKSE